MCSAHLSETAPSRPLPHFRGDRVVADVLELRSATREAPPQLRPAWANLERAYASGDEAAIDYALRELVVAGMATMTRIRAAR